MQSQLDEDKDEYEDEYKVGYDTDDEGEGGFLKIKSSSSLGKNSASFKSHALLSTLENREKIALKIQQAVIRSKFSNQNPDSCQKLENNIAILIASGRQGDFAEALSLLHLVRDKNRGIDSQFITYDALVEESENKEERNLAEKKPIIFLRDARKQPSLEDRKKDKSYSHTYYEGWAGIGLSFISAAKEMIEVEEVKEQTKDNIGQYLKNLAITFFDQVKKSKNPKLVYLVMINKLVSRLATDLDIDEEIVRERLRIAREFTNFDQSSLIMATLTQYKNMKVATTTTTAEEKTKTFEGIDIFMPVAGKVDSGLEGDYKKIKIWDGQSDIGVKWFDRQPEDGFIKKLIQKHIDQIQAKQIPTQLRKILVGARNLAQVTSYMREEKEEEFTPISNFYRFGHPADPKNKETLKHVLAQLHILTEAETLNIHSLINIFLGKLDEANVNAQMKPEKEKSVSPAKDEVTWHYSNTPLQATGMLAPGSSSSVASSNLMDVLAVLEKNEENSDKTKNHKKALQEMVSEYKKLIPVRETLAFEPHMDFLLNEAIFSYKRRHNLHLAALECYMFFLKSIIQLAEAKTPDEKAKVKRELAYFICCMSGKDRTGALAEYIGMFAKLYHIEGKVPSVDFMKESSWSQNAKEVCRVTLDSAQSSTYAGLPGCSPFSYGTLGSSKTGESSGMSAADMPTLNEETSGHNKTPQKLPKTTRSIVLGVLAVIVGLGLLATGIGAAFGVGVLVAAAVSAMSTLHISGSILLGTSIVVGAGAIGGGGYKYYKNTDLRKTPSSSKYNYKTILAIAAIAIGIGLCATGIGAFAGIPLLATTAALVAATGTAAGIITGAVMLLGGLGVLNSKLKLRRKISQVAEAFDIELETVSKRQSSQKVRRSNSLSVLLLPSEKLDSGDDDHDKDWKDVSSPSPSRLGVFHYPSPTTTVVTGTDDNAVATISPKKPSTPVG